MKKIFIYILVSGLSVFLFVQCSSAKEELQLNRNSPLNRLSLPAAWDDENSDRSDRLAEEADELLFDWLFNPQREINFSKGMAKLEESLRLNPTNPTALILQGLVGVEFGRYRDALNHIDLVKEQEEQLITEALWVEAVCHYMLGNDDKSRAAIEQIEEEGHEANLLLPAMAERGLVKKESRRGHYLAFYDQTLSEQEEVASSLLESLLKKFEKLTGIKSEKNVVHRYFLFNSKKAYLHFLEQVEFPGIADKEDIILSDATYDPNSKAIAVYVSDLQRNVSEGFTKIVMPLVFKPALIQYLDCYMPYTPEWFHLSLGEYFKESIVDKNRILLGSFYYDSRKSGEVSLSGGDLISATTMDKLDALVHLHTGQRGLSMAGERLVLISLVDLINSQGDLFSAKPVSAELQGWSFFHFLQHSKEMRSAGPKLIKSYISSIRNKQQTEKDAYRKTFGTLKFNNIDSAWKGYVGRKIRRFSVELP